MTTHTAHARVERWDDLPGDTPMPLLERRRVIGEHAMISRVLLHSGCDVPTHAHANEQLCIVLTGRAIFGLGRENTPDRREIEVGPGDVVVLPPWAPHSCRALEETLILDVFSPPSTMTGIDHPTGA
ncbi:MAG: cupin domain-containing protein [Phycisphaeraceae bacterium]|nr:cupin domain-containing protein [Phycisphaeraceae bacterium]MCW5754245.1 cupin domain-containing protein [Phycisphaeraceae bacterium]